MICCTVCGLWSPCLGGDRLDICQDCFDNNFAGNLVEPPTARDALEVFVHEATRASVSSSHHLTPCQRDALARLHMRWEEEAVRRLAGEET